MKKINFLITILAFVTLSVISCSKDETIVDNEEEATDGSGNSNDNNNDSGESHEDSNDYTWDTSNIIDITLNGSSISANNDGVTVNGTTATITKAATYRISGNLSNGQIAVNTEDKATTKIILNGVDITNNSSAPFVVSEAEKTVVILAENSQNKLTDTSNYTFANGEDEPNATLFSKDDLTIYGQSGANLTIDAKYKDAIKSKDGLVIRDAVININSVDDGIQGKDYLIFKSGTFAITTNGDGLKSNNDGNENVGYINIETGTFTITAGADAVQAESKIKITGGTFNLKAGGGSNASVTSNESAKGLKAKKEILIENNPSFIIDVAEDGIHSDDNIHIKGGVFTIAANDDGIHSDKTLTFDGGDITITKSEEGVEASQLTFNDGNLKLTANDDGVNAAGDFSPIKLDINGGTIVANTGGDGLDANGTITMTDGLVIVNGPSGGFNGALDYDDRFNISGGFILALGTRNMAQTASSSSNQNSFLYSSRTTRSAGTLVHLQKDNSDKVFTFKSSKSFESVAFSSPDLVSGTTYQLYFGGNATGTTTNGLYNDGSTYSNGSLSNTFTVSSRVTNLN